MRLDMCARVSESWRSPSWGRRCIRGRIDSTRGGDLGVDRSLNLFFGGIGREHEGVVVRFASSPLRRWPRRWWFSSRRCWMRPLAGVVEVVDLGTRKTRYLLHTLAHRRRRRCCRARLSTLLLSSFTTFSLCFFEFRWSLYAFCEANFFIACLASIWHRRRLRLLRQRCPSLENLCVENVRFDGWEVGYATLHVVAMQVGAVVGALVFRVGEGDTTREAGEERRVIVVALFVLGCRRGLPAGRSDKGGHDGEGVGIVRCL